MKPPEEQFAITPVDGKMSVFCKDCRWSAPVPWRGDGDPQTRTRPRQPAG